MARSVFLLLLLGNLVFFIWAAGYLGGRDTGREPERLRDQLQPERLQISRLAEGGSSEPRAAAEPPVPAPAADAVCRRLGPMAAADAERLKASLAVQGISATPLAAEEVSYWVFIPPNAAKSPEKVAAELKQLGVAEFFVVSESGPDRGAISLGLFHREEMAKDFLQQLAKKGVRTAKIGNKSRKGDKLRLEVRGDAKTLDAMLKDQAGEAIDCPRQ